MPLPLQLVFNFYCPWVLHLTLYHRSLRRNLRETLGLKMADGNARSGKDWANCSPGGNYLRILIIRNRHAIFVEHFFDLEGNFGGRVSPGRFEQLSDRLTLTETDKDNSKNKTKADKLKMQGVAGTKGKSNNSLMLLRSCLAPRHRAMSSTTRIFALMGDVSVQGWVPRLNEVR